MSNMNAVQFHPLETDERDESVRIFGLSERCPSARAHMNEKHHNQHKKKKKNSALITS